MKITVSKVELFNKLRSIGKIIPSKSSLPAYDNFLFNVNESGKLFITAGDEGGRMSIYVDCLTDFSGEMVMVPAKTILDALKEIPEQPIMFELEKQKNYFNIRCEYSGGRFELLGGLGTEYPIIEMRNEESPIKVFTEDFLYGIRQVQFCAADDELRPVINGIYFDKVDDKVTYVASNGTILGMVETTLESGTGKSAFIIPSKYAKILSSIIPADCQEVEIIVDSTNIAFNFDGYSLLCRMIEGRFPNYRAVIPTKNDKKTIVSKDELLAALKRVSVFSNRSTSLVAINAAANEIVLKAQDIDYSISAEEKLPIDDYQGAPIKIGFNANYLKELLSNIPSEKLVMSFMDPSRAALLHRCDEDSISLTYLIMPISIN